MIEADRLTRRYGDFVAVDEVSFAIGRGEIVGLLGHNGAGKTTIMKMLTGYLEPSAGSVRVNGIEVEADRQAVQQQMGYLPENLPLYPELTVVDYLSYTAELRGVDPATAVPRAVAATELGDKAFDVIATLSRGYRQRVGVAQAILHEPRYLILDEPTNGLDPGQTRQMRELIRRLASSATIILSTHIMQEVNAICDRAVILRNGRLVLDQRMDEIHASRQLAIRTASEGNLLEVLADVPGIGGLRQTGEGLWEADVSGSLDGLAEAIARRLVDRSLPVYQIAPVQRDLETIFTELNEAAPATGEGAATAGEDSRHAA